MLVKVVDNGEILLKRRQLVIRTGIGVNTGDYKGKPTARFSRIASVIAAATVAITVRISRRWSLGVSGATARYGASCVTVAGGLRDA